MIDLNRLDEYRENNRIEAKKALGGLPHSIWETYSAFANTLGGIILLGVEEYRDKSLHPVDLPDPEGLIREFWDCVNNPRFASVNVLTERQVRMEEAEGNRIVVIEVPRAQRTDKPVYVEGNPTQGAYRRSGEGDYHCSPEELQAMARDAARKTQDMLVLEALDDTVFSPESVRSYREKLALSRPGHPWETLPDREFLEKTGALASGRKGGLHPTAAGLLLFGTEPAIRREYPHYSLTYRELPRQDGDPLELSSSAGDWSGNVFDFFSRVSERLAPDRDDPVGQSLREALANCLVNADYYGAPGVTVLREPGQVVLENPGVFRIGLDDARSGGRSDPRNGALMGMFNLLAVGDGNGSGIPGIFYAWQQQGWSEPVITQTYAPDRVRLTLPLERRPAAEKPDKHRLTLGKAAQKEILLQYMTDHAGAGAGELSALLAGEGENAEALLQELMEEGLVSLEGEPPVYKLKR